MPSLQEILEEDLGLGSEKVASQMIEVDDPDLEKLASEMGLFGDSVTDEEVEQEKVASELPAMGGLYNELFPEDSDFDGVQKTASQQAEDDYQEKLGSMAFDSFAYRFDQRIEKIAAEVMSGDATVDAAEASISGDNPHDDSRPSQSSSGNRPDDADEAIDTEPEYTDEVTAKNDEKAVGNYEQKTAMNLAIRKHLLLASR